MLASVADGYIFLYFLTIRYSLMLSPSWIIFTVLPYYMLCFINVLFCVSGPCGGKTTGQTRLSTFFENLGWRVSTNRDYWEISAVFILQCGQIQKNWWKSTPNKEIYSILKSEIFASSRHFCRDSSRYKTQQWKWIFLQESMQRCWLSTFFYLTLLLLFKNSMKNNSFSLTHSNAGPEPEDERWKRQWSLIWGCGDICVMCFIPCLFVWLCASINFDVGRNVCASDTNMWGVITGQHSNTVVCERKRFHTIRNKHRSKRIWHKE